MLVLPGFRTLEFPSIDVTDMYVLENPVLQRELLTNLRMTRAFVLLFVYVALLGGVVWLAWPQQQRLDLAQPEAAKRLVESVLLWAVHAGLADGAELCGGGDHWRKGADELRDVAGDAAAAGGDCARQAVCGAMPSWASS